MTDETPAERAKEETAAPPSPPPDEELERAAGSPEGYQEIARMGRANAATFRRQPSTEEASGDPQSPDAVEDRERNLRSDSGRKAPPSRAI